MLRIRSGQMLMQRVGTLNPTRQRDLRSQTDGSLTEVGKRNTRAPEPKGLWAFPFPLFEPFFTSYQRELALPPRFRRAAFTQIERDFRDGRIDEATRDARADALGTQLAAWERSEAGRARTRVRRFWFSGKAYTHLGLGPKGEGAYDAGGWQLVGVKELARLVEHDYAHSAAGLSRPYSCDQYEVFLGRDARIH